LASATESKRNSQKDVRRFQDVIVLAFVSFPIANPQEVG